MGLKHGLLKDKTQWSLPSQTTDKSHFQTDYRSNAKGKTLKVSANDIREFLYDFGTRKSFLNRIFKNTIL